MKVKMKCDITGTNIKTGDIFEVIGEANLGNSYFLEGGIQINKIWCEVYNKVKTTYLECIEDNNIFKKGDVAILVEDKGLVYLVKTTVNNNLVELNVMARFFKEVGSVADKIKQEKMADTQMRNKCRECILQVTNPMFSSTVEYNLNLLETLIKNSIQ